MYAAGVMAWPLEIINGIEVQFVRPIPLPFESVLKARLYSGTTWDTTLSSSLSCLS